MVMHSLGDEYQNISFIFQIGIVCGNQLSYLLTLGSMNGFLNLLGLPFLRSCLMVHQLFHISQFSKMISLPIRSSCSMKLMMLYILTERQIQFVHIDFINKFIGLCNYKNQEEFIRIIL